MATLPYRPARLITNDDCAPASAESLRNPMFLLRGACWGLLRAAAGGNWTGIPGACSVATRGATDEVDDSQNASKELVIPWETEGHVRRRIR